MAHEGSKFAGYNGQQQMGYSVTASRRVKKKRKAREPFVDLRGW